MHTGDFKFDQSQLSQNSDLGKIAQIGNQGVLCVLNDSTNAEKPGYTLSESIVKQEISDVVYNAKGRVLAACLSTNVGRIQQVIEATVTNQRKLVVISHPADNNFDIAKELGYINIPEDLIVSVNELNNLDSSNLVVLTIGTHSHLMAALLKMAKGAHKHVSVNSQDTVMICASPTPGTEITVGKVIDKLFRTGANVLHSQKKIHSSGHGCQEELKLMLNLLKPRYVIPIQGSLKCKEPSRKWRRVWALLRIIYFC